MQPGDAAPTSCPNCGCDANRGAVECTRCGIIFGKFRARPALVPHLEDPGPLLPIDEATPNAGGRDLEWWGHALLLVVLTWWTWSFAAQPFGPAVAESILHLPNLIFHEAGHVLFMPFGRFISVLAGSGFQIALPLALAGVFLHQDNRFGALVCLWWAGQNLVDVSPYIADARALRLVLLGGRTGAEVEGHDWEFILTQLGWLRRDLALGLWTYRAGLLTMAAAIAAGAFTLLSTGPLRRPHHPHTAA